MRLQFLEAAFLQLKNCNLEKWLYDQTAKMKSGQIKRFGSFLLFGNGLFEANQMVRE